MVLHSVIVLHVMVRPLLTNGVGGGGSLWGCLRTRQPTHPPKLTHPPTHPDRPYPPIGGGGGLCCYNQLVTQKPCVFAPKKICPSATMQSLNSSIAELAVTLMVVDHCTSKLVKRWFNPRCLRTGNFYHFLPHGPEIFATF